MTTGRPVEREAVTVGVIAAVAVAAFYAVFDQLAARGPLYTVNLLGLSLFKGVRDPAVRQLPIAIDMAGILMYTGVHLALSVVIGFVVTRLIAQAERDPTQARTMLALIVAGYLLTIVGFGYLTAPMRALLPWWSIVVANSAAVVVVGAYLLKRHPGLAGRMLG
jgi:protein-S-isoprenylcysteine O-methyltransferase Ste14